MDRILIVYPAFAMLILTFFAYVKSRLILNKCLKEKSLSIKQIKLYTGELPEEFEQSRQHLKNQFELPVFFYLLIALLYSSSNFQLIDIVLAWMFVASRYIHSYIRFTSNYLPHRARLFILGMLLLMISWIKFVLWDNLLF